MKVIKDKIDPKKINKATTVPGMKMNQSMINKMPIDENQIPMPMIKDGVMPMDKMEKKMKHPTMPGMMVRHIQRGM